MVFEVFSDDERNLVTFVTDDKSEEFLSLKEKEQHVDKNYNKKRPIPSRSNSNENKWIIMYEKIK